MKNNFFPWKLDQNWKLWIFLLQFCKFSAILWCNLFKILDFDRNNLFKHCCFLNFWFWDQKKVAYFFRAIGVPTKIKSFQKILGIDQSGELQKKSWILHQAPQITLFCTHPVFLSQNMFCLFKVRLHERIAQQRQQFNKIENWKT